MNDNIVLSTREFLLYVAIAGALIGAVLGLLPLLLGRRRGRGRLGLYGFVLSIVVGAIAPVLSLAVVGVFAWLILKDGGRNADTTAPDPVEGDASSS